MIDLVHMVREETDQFVIQKFGKEQIDEIFRAAHLVRESKQDILK